MQRGQLVKYTYCSSKTAWLHHEGVQLSIVTKDGAACISYDMRTLPSCSAGIRTLYILSDGSAMCTRKHRQTGLLLR